MSFDQALKFTIGTGGKDLGEEGGFNDLPEDAGGPTNRGVSQHVYDSYRQMKGYPVQSVALITDAETRELYENMYWEPSKAQLMHSPLDVVHMDWSVNHGISGAIKTLQAALGVPVDGIWGSQTSSALATADSVETAQTYNSLRREWYRNRVAQKPDQEVFLKGWLARVDRLDAYCEGL